MNQLRRIVFHLVSVLLGPFLAILLCGPPFLPIILLTAVGYTWIGGLLAFLWLLLVYLWLKHEEKIGSVAFHPSKFLVLTIRHEVSLSADFCWRLFVVDSIIVGVYILVYGLGIL